MHHKGTPIARINIIITTYNCTDIYNNISRFLIFLNYSMILFLKNTMLIIIYITETSIYICIYILKNWTPSQKFTYLCHQYPFSWITILVVFSFKPSVTNYYRNMIRPLFSYIVYKTNPYINQNMNNFFFKTKFLTNQAQE